MVDDLPTEGLTAVLGVCARKYGTPYYLWHDDTLGFARRVLRYDPWSLPAEALAATDTETEVAIPSSMGTGKGVDVEDSVLTPTGWIRAGDIAVGDLMVGRSGEPTEVLAVYDRGVLPMTRVTFSDGVSVRCDTEHLWTVRDTGRWQTRDTAWLAGHVLNGQGHARWRIPLVEPVQHPDANLPIEPYLLGVLLANGHLSGGVGWSSNDAAITAEVRRRGTGVHEVAAGTARRWALDAPGPVRERLRHLGLWEQRSTTKWVPSAYLTASESQRRAVLAALLDCDGSVRVKNGQAEYSTRSRALANAVRTLTESLGGTCREHIPTSRDGGTDYVVTLSVPSCPFLLERKAVLWRAPRRPGRRIVSIVADGTAEVRCFTVDASDSLYVIDHYVVTHNTSWALRTSSDAPRGGRGSALAALALSAERTTATSDALTLLDTFVRVSSTTRLPLPS